MSDIQSIDDIKIFVDFFYQKLIADTNINQHFLHLDLNDHLPHVYSFWEMILFGNPNYKTNMMEKHFHLKLTNEDFYIWLRHFESSVNAHFEGEKASEVISRANMIAMTMRAKLLNKE